jgi:outer membrane biosynthesis protein TonB
MQPIQINVQVSIGLNSELSALLMSVVNRPAQVAELPAAPRNKKPAKPQPEPKPEVTNQPTPTDGQATASEEPEPQPEAAKPEPEPAPVQEPAPEPQQEPEPAQEGAKEYTEVDVRAAMDRTRKRIEGENYKEKPDSEGYKKWHRVLTRWFKDTAAIYGAEKPSALPDSESRAKFIARCDAVQVKGDELIEDCPF